MKKLTLIIAFIAMFLGVTYAQSTTVTATGMGPTKSAATNDAQRQAIEQAVGALVDSSTMVQNFQLVEDKILTKSRGFVRSYKVLSEKQASDGQWEVKIEAVVDQGKLKGDLNAIGLLRQKMGNPRLMVLYDPTQLGTNFDPRDPAIVNAYDGIVDGLTKLEFQVVDKNIADQFTLRKFSQSQDIYKEASQFGLANQAEYIVVYSIRAVPQPKQVGFFRTQAQISAKVINTSTANIVANQMIQGMGMDKNDEVFAYQKGARKAGENVTKWLIEKVLKAWQSQTVNGRPVIIEFLHIKDFSMMVTIRAELKKANGVKTLTQRGSTSTSAELEVNYVGEIDNLVDSIYAIFGKLGKKVAMPMAMGDRISVDFARDPDAPPPTDADVTETPIETPTPDPIVVEKAITENFVGYFEITDPTRTYEQYHGNVSLYADGTGKCLEVLNGKTNNDPHNDDRGYHPITWKWDQAKRQFTFDWNCDGKYKGHGYFEGPVSGNTNDFTINGTWSNGSQGKLTIKRVD